MPKLDFSELTKKFDIQGLLDSVKSAVGTTAPAKAPEGDEVAAKFVELLTLTQQLATVNAEQAKAISTLHTKLGGLYKDIQALKETAPVTAAPTAAENPTTTSAGTTEEEEKPLK